jgi:hypothetical protein
LKTLIYRLICFTVFALWVNPVHAGSFSTKMGIYDFSGNEAREFYKYAYTVLGTYAFWESPISRLEVSSGAIYTSVEYDASKHQLLIIPLHLSCVLGYQIQVGGNGIKPFIGGGLSGYYKRDKSATSGKSYEFVTYGYHSIIGFMIPVGYNTSFIFEMRNNMVMSTNTMEEIDFSGTSSLFGFNYRFY